MGPLTSHIFRQLLSLPAITSVRHVSETFLRNGAILHGGGGGASIMLHKGGQPLIAVFLVNAESDPVTGLIAP